MFVLRFLQARDPRWVGRPFFAAYDPAATWFSQLVPAFGRPQFFFSDDHDAPQRRAPHGRLGRVVVAGPQAARLGAGRCKLATWMSLARLSGQALRESVRGLGDSPTLAINERSAALRAAGARVFSLGLGQSPFPVPAGS